MLEKLIPGLTLWKLVAIGLFLALIFGGGYYYGQKGQYKSGFDDGVKSTAKQISDLKGDVAKLTKTINDEHDASNKKISELERQAALLTSDNAKLSESSKLARQQGIADYIKKNPQTQHSCGWSAPTVEIINSVLEGMTK